MFLSQKNKKQDPTKGLSSIKIDSLAAPSHINPQDVLPRLPQVPPRLHNTHQRRHRADPRRPSLGASQEEEAAQEGEAAQGHFGEGTRTE